jgi:uncharacterized membrane protein
MKKSRIETRSLILLALLTAIVAVLTYFEQFIFFGPFNITLALVPIVIGAALCGTLAGGWLGLVFGGVVLLTGQASAFLGVNALGTILLVFLKGAASGLAAGAVYKLLSGKNITVGAVGAALSAPIANTGIFILGCYAFFLPTVSEWGSAAGFDNAGAYIVFGLVGLNFLVEFVSTAALSGVIVRLISIGRRGNV